MNRFTKNIVITTAFILVSSLIFTQTNQEIEKKNRRKQKLIENINYTNSLIKKAKKNQKVTQNQLIVINQKIAFRRELINTLSVELGQINSKIDQQKTKVENLENEVKDLKEEYSKLIYRSYVNRNKYDKLVYIFAAEDFNQAYNRVKYLQQYGEYRRKQFNNIKSTQDSITNVIASLNLNKVQKEAALNDLLKEESALAQDQQDQQNVLQKLRGDEQALNAKLKKQRRDKIKLDNAIQALIKKAVEEARIKAEKEAAAKQARANKASALDTKSKQNSNKHKLTPEAIQLSASFGTNKGKLPWPVRTGVITGFFGNHPHPVIKNVMIPNNGIDITTDPNSIAQSVFEGEVNSVFSIQGAGQTVMVNHGAYFTVYSNLKEVYVSRGDKVKNNTPLGTVLTNSEAKTILHFELWKSANDNVHKQNPYKWILRQ